MTPEDILKEIQDKGTIDPEKHSELFNKLTKDPNFPEFIGLSMQLIVEKNEEKLEAVSKRLMEIIQNL